MSTVEPLVGVIYALIAGAALCSPSRTQPREVVVAALYGLLAFVHLMPWLLHANEAAMLFAAS
jgi:hypothetical protein